MQILYLMYRTFIYEEFGALGFPDNICHLGSMKNVVLKKDTLQSK